MPEIWLDGLFELGRRLKSVEYKLPKLRKQIHEEIAQSLKRGIDSNINATINDSHGKIRDWQVPRVGSGGGYAAISPTSKPPGKNGAGAITNYLENGHMPRRAAANSKYVYTLTKADIRRAKEIAERRAKQAGTYIEGRDFYQKTEKNAVEEAVKAGHKLIDKVVKEIEG